MKNHLALLCAFCLLLTCLSGCDNYEGKIDWEISYANGDTCTVFQLEDFCGTTTINMKRKHTGDGTFYYWTFLTSGSMTVSSYDDLLSGTQTLFTATARNPLEGNTGYIERDGTYPITFTAEMPVSGKIMISFAPFYAGLPFGLEDPTKGIEIYCFKDHITGEWFCSALPGTNGGKIHDNYYAMRTTLENMNRVLKNLGLTNCATLYYIESSCEDVFINDPARYADDYAYLRTALGLN